MREKLFARFVPVQQRFETAWLPRYRQLDGREQRLLLVAAMVLPVVIVVFGLLLPMNDRRQSLRSDLSRVQKQAAEAEQLAQYLLKHQGRTQPASGSAQLLTTVEQLARKTGVRQYMTRIRPQNSPDGASQRLMARMKDAPYDAALRWIYALAGEHVGLQSLKIEASDKPGYIHLRAMLTNR